MDTLVSILIPTVERLAYLKEAVGSALAQDCEGVEVIVGDDGDSKELRAWCEEIAAREPRRFRYRKNARRLGLAGNWNALADAARGEHLAIIGDDDRLLPNFVSALLEAGGSSSADGSFDVAFSNHYLIDGAGARLERESRECSRAYGRDALRSGELQDAASAVWRNSVPVSASLMRASSVRRLRFKEDLNTPEIELFARMAEEGARFVFAPEYLAEYRTHAKSATSAGLYSERLAERLLDVQVRREVEGYKREFMSGLLVNAVSRCLERGERERARRFLRSEYYPTFKSAKPKAAASLCVQSVCAALPASVGARAYRLAKQIKTGLNL